MTISHDTQEKMKKFAREQTEAYLHEAEMTYMEKMRRKVNQTKGKMNTKIARFKNSSEASKEAQGDMFLYMHDYVEDLVARGMDEEQALKKATEDLKMSSETVQSAYLQERFQQYYPTTETDQYEVIGLVYGGLLFLGLGIGGMVGFITGGGVSNFTLDGWIYTVTGVGIGGIIGLGLGLISNAVIIAKKQK